MIVQLRPGNCFRESLTTESAAEALDISFAAQNLYSSLAMYDAVNAITGDYKPFSYRIAGPSNASIDAAAVAAAHRILVNYFPSQQTTQDSQFTASLAVLISSQDAKTAGVTVGQAAALAVISVRTGEGLQSATLAGRMASDNSAY
jgi:hypothetical protein